MEWIFAICVMCLLWVMCARLEASENRLHDIYLLLSHKQSRDEKIYEATEVRIEAIIGDIGKLKSIAEEYERNFPARYSDADIRELEILRKWRMSMDE